jgi:hypothetical protein
MERGRRKDTERGRHRDLGIYVEEEETSEVETQAERKSTVEKTTNRMS